MKEKLIATLLVALHVAVAVGHGNAHLHLHIQLSAWQRIFIGVVILIGPVLAVGLLWTRLKRTASVLLLVTMAGSLLFGVAYHFVVPGSDNALHLHEGPWESLFGMTATWLALIETGAVVWCVWVLRRRFLESLK
jgi:hypothetical protein